MCRLLAFNTRENVDIKILKIFSNVAEKDFLSSTLSHSDGWGISTYIYNNSWKNLFYKSKDPIYKDTFYESISGLLNGEKIIGLVHARKAGKKFLHGVTHSHPYHLKVKNYELYFAHNGSVSRKAFQNPLLPYTDSFLILLEISKEIENGYSPLDAYNIVFNRLKPFSTSLNSVLLTFNEAEGPKIYVGYYYNKERLKEIEEYYKLYRFKDYVFSSTLKFYFDNDIEELIYGDIITLE
ncbi:class II glutamine amidotransferase [Acidianus brierleyi]|uniref:Glutamine amidotransferase n=1 Tax=Acidianus brierleyi TaxID=41673 RepID=A0A2U9IE04_9CREN|nr:class II glutamine amidotransferase [Acidianus brierleyi]AWR94273.1 class II glutamine amidotransferase [Acidianus brierleyi]